MSKKKSFYIIYVILLLGFHSGLSAEPTYRELCHDAETLLESKHYDSSSTLFLKAYAAGMPAESLYYFWGEVYRSKSVLDSALALNFAAGRSAHEKNFVRRVLVQRYRLYETLKWEEARVAVEDTLERMFGPRGLAPDIQMRGNVGYETGQFVVDTASPWSGETDRTELNKGFAYQASLRLKWPLALIPKDRVHFGLRTAVDKPYWTGAQSRTFDSASVTGAAFIGLNVLDKKVSLSGEGVVRRFYNQEYTFGYSVDLAYVPLPTEKLLFFSAGYSVSMDRDLDPENHTVYVMEYSSTPAGRLGNLDIIVNATAFVADPLTLSALETGVAVYVEDVTAATPVHYTGSDFATVIDRTDYQSTLAYSVAIGQSAGITSIVLEKELPQTQFSVRPDIRIRKPVSQKLTLGVGAGYSLIWFPQPYTWSEGKVYADGQLYALNGVDQRLYSVTDGPRSTGGLFGGLVETFGEPVGEVTHYRVYRTDQVLSGRLDAEYVFSRAGTVSVGGAWSRTWSTLSERAPVTIPESDLSVMLGWSHSITIDRKPWEN